MVGTPFYFGSSARQLYGVYEEPAADTRAGDTAVVLAYPAFPTYNKAHWVFRRLAQRSAQEGFFTLRFDYFATGDSAGSSDAGTFDQWVDDIATAAEEARDLSGAREVSVVGMHLGATLAASAVDAGLDLQSLVLWDPVIHGPDHMTHLLARARIQRRVRLLSARRPAGQLLGYPLSERLRHDIESIDLLALDLGRAQHVETVWTGDEADLEAFEQRMTSTRASARGSTRCTIVRGEQATRRGSGEMARLSTAPIDTVVDALLRAGS